MGYWNSLTPQQQAALFVEEEDLEMKSLDAGILRYKENTKAQPMSKRASCRSLIGLAAENLTSAIEVETSKVVAGRGMRGGNQWGHVFIYMDARVLAAASIMSMIDLMADGGVTSPQQAVTKIGRDIEQETHFTILKREAPKLKAVMERRIKRWDSRSLRAALKKIDQDCTDRWGIKRKRLIGAKLLDLAVTDSGIFGTRVVTGRGPHGKPFSRKEIYLTDDAMESISRMDDHLELLSPRYEPMIVPPNRWSNDVNGGYTVLSRYHNMVKSGLGDTSSGDPRDHGDIPYRAINALQETPYTINPVVLSTMQHVWLHGGGMGVPPAENLPIPPRPDVEDDREWRVKAEQVYRENARLVGRRIQFLKTMATAVKYRRRVFFFPWQYDFRSRLYPIPAFLQPQGPDMARGLLNFGDGKKLGKRGMRWLMIRLSNCWGVDKVSFQKRVEFSTKLMLDAPADFDPLSEAGKRLWSDADEPWQALATVADIIAARNYEGGVENYISYLPVNVDGSNSGLQHFSAMLRDAEGAALVNLTDLPEPSDPYQNVSDAVECKVNEDCRTIESGVIEGPQIFGSMWSDKPDVGTTLLSLPQQWLDYQITRKVTKRGTMTYPYGVTEQGLRDNLIEDGHVDWASNQFAASRYLGKKIWEAIRENITGAAEAMDWLRHCATVANKHDVLLQWRTPSGFLVRHPYSQLKDTRVRCLNGETIFKSPHREGGVRASKQRTGLPPNFVHSLDATHLMMTVVAGVDEGVDSWLMIHDSFGTHACDVDTLRDVLRQQFVNLYSGNVLEDFRQQVETQTGEDPGDPPAQGNFDLNEVLQSEYIFA